MLVLILYFEDILRAIIFTLIYWVFNLIFKIIFLIPNLINLVYINHKCKKGKKNLNNHIKIHISKEENIILKYNYGKYIYVFTDKGIYYQKYNLTHKYIKNNHFYSYDDIKEISFGIKSIMGYKIHFSNFNFKNNLTQKNKLYFIYRDGNLLQKEFPKIKKILS